MNTKHNIKITASAPGKLLLLGDHAVVYGRPCLVTAVSTRLEVSIEEKQTPGIEVITPGNGNNVFLQEVLAYASSLWPLPKNFIISTKSPFTGKYGFGSSSAFTVASLKVLSEISHISLTEKELFDHAYKVVLKVQGIGSGFDVASAIYGGTIMYQNKGEVIERISHPPYKLVVGYSGKKANTVEIVKDIAKKKEQYPERLERLFTAIGDIVLQSKQAFREGDYERVGKLMDFNQEYLRDLGVSTEPLETIISAAKQAGAWGAKLSGAGGGDCMIAIVSEDKFESVSTAIANASGEVVPVLPDEEGVRIETTDNLKELFVVVDKDDTVIGSRTRVDCHHDKTLIHRSVGVIIIDDLGRILLQKRSKTKDTRPGYWSTSVGGHVMNGETYRETAKREAKEELNIDIDPIYKTKQVFQYDNEAEMTTIFTAHHNGPFDPNPNEVSDVHFFRQEELQELSKDPSFLLTESARNELHLGGFL